MLKKTREGVYQSTLFKSIPGLTHGYSTKTWGDMRDRARQREFAGRLLLSCQNLVAAEQIHENMVKVVGSKDMGLVIDGVDGLVSNTCGDKLPVLSVHVADCVPILAVDPETKIIGVAHAGWRGSLGNVAGNLIKTMKKVGANPRNILVSLGPHIGSCCYSVDEARADKFSKSFKNDESIAFLRGKKWYVDLGKANLKQLREVGVLESHIDNSAPCTFDKETDFFSYRRDNKSTFGEILGVIAYEDRKN